MQPVGSILMSYLLFLSSFDLCLFFIHRLSWTLILAGYKLSFTKNSRRMVHLGASGVHYGDLQSYLPWYGLKSDVPTLSICYPVWWRWLSDMRRHYKNAWWLPCLISVLLWWLLLLIKKSRFVSGFVYKVFGNHEVWICLWTENNFDVDEAHQPWLWPAILK